MNAVWFEVGGGLAVGASLGLIGAGGAILSVPIFAEALNHPTKQAIAEALVVTCAVAAAGTARSALKRTVDWPRVALMGVPGIVGALFGGYLARMLSDPVQMSLFGVVALVAAWRMIAPAPHVHESRAEHRKRRTVIALESAAVGLGIGVLTGLIGIGGGFLLVPALVVILREPMHRAVGTSLAIITLNSASGYLGGQLSADPAHAIAMDWRAVSTVAACGVAGSLLGGLVGDRLPSRLLRQIFAVVLVCIAGLVLVRQFWPGR